MKLLFFSLLVLQCCFGFTQTPPKILIKYENDTDINIYRSLILSDDSIFFAYSKCECGTERFTKGKWQLKDGYLYLNSFADSLYSIYPTIDYSYGADEVDSVDIYVTNYFNEPNQISILVFKYEDSLSKSLNPKHIYLGKQGHTKLSNKIYSGFMMEYDQYRNDLTKGDILGYYFNSKKLHSINIKFDFSNATYDRQLIKENLGQIKYKISNNNLYTEEDILVYELVTCQVHPSSQINIDDSKNIIK